MMNSRPDIRRPSRDSAVTRISPSRVSHQNRSLPASRCGSIGALVAIDRSTWRVAASSSAIWNPELPPPTTSTGPAGRACGLRYSALCSWVTEPSSRWAAGGTNGTWNGPVATTTWRARKTSSWVRTSKPSSVRLRSVTRAFSLTGRSNAAA